MEEGPVVELLDMEEGPVVQFEIRARGQRQGQLLRLECSQDYIPLSMIVRPEQEKYLGAELLYGSWGVFSLDGKKFEIKSKVALEILVGGTWIELEFGIAPFVTEPGIGTTVLDFSKSDGTLTTEAASKLYQSVEFKDLTLTGKGLGRHGECILLCEVDINAEDFHADDSVTHLACGKTYCRPCLSKWSNQRKTWDVILTCPHCRTRIVGEMSCCLERSVLCGRITSCVEDVERRGTVVHIDSEKWWNTKDEKEDADTKSKTNSGHEPDAEAYKLYKFRIIVYDEKRRFSLLHGELTRSTMPCGIKRDAGVMKELKQHKFQDGIHEFCLLISPDKEQ